MKGGDFWEGEGEGGGLWRRSGGWLGLSTEGRWMVSIFLKATETQRQEEDRSEQVSRGQTQVSITSDVLTHDFLSELIRSCHCLTFLR